MGPLRLRRQQPHLLTFIFNYKRWILLLFHRFYTLFVKVKDLICRSQLKAVDTSDENKDEKRRFSGSEIRCYLEKEELGLFTPEYP